MKNMVKLERIHNTGVTTVRLPTGAQVVGAIFLKGDCYLEVFMGTKVRIKETRRFIIVSNGQELSDDGHHETRYICKAGDARHVIELIV